MWNDFNLEDIEQSANVIFWDCEKKHFVLDDEDFKDCILIMDTPQSELLDKIVENVGTQAKEASKVEVPFDEITLSKEQFWEGSTVERLKAPIGITENGEIQFFEYDQDNMPNGLLIGRSGYGKTNLLHVLINSLCQIYPPWELELYLVDLKRVGFPIYKKYNLPHARVVANKTDRESCLSVLKYLDKEMKENRTKLFEELPIPVETLAEYRQKTEDKLPRILLIIDEFREIFKFGDDIARKSAEILDNIITQGRGFGVHVLLVSQTVQGVYGLPDVLKNNTAVRIALFCSESDSREVLADNNLAANKLSRSGEAIYNKKSGLLDYNIRFQVPLMSKENLVDNLQNIINHAEMLKYVPPQPQIVFDGYTLADIGSNHLLHELLNAFPSTHTKKDVSIWLGKPIDIKEPTKVYFKRQRKNNLIIIGNDDTTAAGILFSSMVSLASQYNQKDDHLYIVNLHSKETTYSNHFTRLSDIIPHFVSMVDSPDLPRIINEIAEKVKKRLKTEPDVIDSSVYLLIFGLQQAKYLKQEEYSSFSNEDDEVIKPVMQFATILKDGPDVGVHTLVWCDSYDNLESRIDSTLPKEFDMRVALQMPETESYDLISNYTANKLGSYTALYLSKNEGKLEKFQPYGLPSEDWLAWVEERFRMKGK